MCIVCKSPGAANAHPVPGTGIYNKCRMRGSTNVEREILYNADASPKILVYTRRSQGSFFYMGQSPYGAIPPPVL